MNKVFGKESWSSFKEFQSECKLLLAASLRCVIGKILENREKKRCITRSTSHSGYLAKNTEWGIRSKVDTREMEEARLVGGSARLRRRLFVVTPLITYISGMLKKNLWRKN